MSSSFQVLYCPNISLTDAPAAEEKVAVALRRAGLVSTYSKDIADAVGRRVRRHDLSESARFLYRKAVPDRFNIGEYVESTVGRYANGWSLNIAQRYACPSCALEHVVAEVGFERVLSQMQSAVILFIDHGQVADINCPACGRSTPASKWGSDVPPAFSHLAFEFWQFPLLVSAAVAIPPDIVSPGSWQLDVPKIVGAAAGHEVGWSMGEI